MPAFIIHGFMGYLLYGKQGFAYGILPDIIGFGPYFFRLLRDYKYNRKNKITDIIDSEKMEKTDWFLYDISHSLIPWIILLLVTKNKFFYASIISIIMDIFLHSQEYKGWRGPKYLYPISDMVFDGIHWASPMGITITSVILFLFIKYKDKIKDKIKGYLKN